MPRQGVQPNPNPALPCRSHLNPPGPRSVTVHISSNEPGEEVWVGIERTGPSASRQTITVAHQVNVTPGQGGRPFRPSPDVWPPRNSPQAAHWPDPATQSGFPETAPLLTSGNMGRRDYNSFQNLNGPPPPYDDNTYDALETSQAWRLSANNAVMQPVDCRAPAPSTTQEDLLVPTIVDGAHHMTN